MIEYFNEDCMTGMARYPDKYFDLAIIDPPYGIGDKKLTQGGTWASKYKIGDCNWDVKPTEDYFSQLIRVSKNQIIWGGNYFNLPPSRCFIIWDKVALIPTMADSEFAWTSFDKNAKTFRHVRNTSEKRIHPTQKPVALYKWLLSNYAKQGDKILDTHVGSASSLIACYEMGFDAVGFELDPDYYAKSKQRLEDFMRQPRIDTIEQQQLEQLML